MAQRTPKIVDMILTMEQASGTLLIPVGSTAWFRWLMTATQFSFHDEGAAFTARKQQQRGYRYWYAYARREKLYCLYLGKSEALTAERLHETLDRLHPPITATPPTYAAELHGRRSRTAARVQTLLHSLYSDGDQQLDTAAARQLIETIGREHASMAGSGQANVLSLAYTLLADVEHERAERVRRIAFLERLLQEGHQHPHDGQRGEVF